jgi:hypothetical protein
MKAKEGQYNVILQKWTSENEESRVQKEETENIKDILAKNKVSKLY